jgi:hypothetical protein
LPLVIAVMMAVEQKLIGSGLIVFTCARTSPTISGYLSSTTIRPAGVTRTATSPAS